jgi:hypothetical protein
MLIALAFLLGFVFAFTLRLIVIGIREKKGRDYVKYNSLPLTSRMKIAVREIIFKYSIRKFNRDFLLSIKLHEHVIMQLMHRSHFPDIIKDLSDVKFGIAIYIPIKPLTNLQRDLLLKILREEMEHSRVSEPPIEYVVIDAGTRARYNGYLIAKIIKEVFKADDVYMEISDEGVLPYHYTIDIPTRLN